MERNRIAIVNAHWHLQSTVAYIANSLDAAGHEVDLFLYECDEGLSGKFLRESANVRVHRFAGNSSSHGNARPASKNGLRQFILDHMPKFIRARLKRMRDNAALQRLPASKMIPAEIVAKIEDICRAGRPCGAILGVEKGGLAFAGQIAERTGIPLMYYSLELYTQDHPWLHGSIPLQRLKLIEEQYHSKCALTIVQDKPRTERCLKSNNVSLDAKVAYLPVSALGPPNRDPSDWLQRELSLPGNETILLFYGMMNRERHCIDLARAAKHFPPGSRLVFHGYGPPEVIADIKAIDSTGRISVSTRLVPAEEREVVIRSAHIGLALYGNGNANDRLTGFASEKIALYLKCGVPLIAFRYPSYQHLEAEGAAVLVDKEADIPAAAKKIQSSYATFSRNAYACFERHYCFENAFVSVLKSIDEVAVRPRKGDFLPAGV